MGINLIWQDEKGKPIDRIDDPQNLLGLLVLATPLDEFICLRFLDPYGDAYFNQSQIPVLLAELTDVKAMITDSQFQSYYAHQVAQAEEARLGASVIKQFRQAQETTAAARVQDHLGKVIELVRRSAGATHTYLRFVGD